MLVTEELRRRSPWRGRCPSCVVFAVRWSYCGMPGALEGGAYLLLILGKGESGQYPVSASGARLGAHSVLQHQNSSSVGFSLSYDLGHTFLTLPPSSPPTSQCPHAPTISGLSAASACEGPLGFKDTCLWSCPRTLGIQYPHWSVFPADELSIDTCSSLTRRGCSHTRL